MLHSSLFSQACLFVPLFIKYVLETCCVRGTTFNPDSTEKEYRISAPDAHVIVCPVVRARLIIIRDVAAFLVILSLLLSFLQSVSLSFSLFLPSLWHTHRKLGRGQVPFTWSPDPLFGLFGVSGFPLLGM